MKHEPSPELVTSTVGFEANEGCSAPRAASIAFAEKFFFVAPAQKFLRFGSAWQKKPYAG
jgi:hypothetical protein